jgi:hypothetical protein
MPRLVQLIANPHRHLIYMYFSILPIGNQELAVLCQAKQFGSFVTTLRL